MASKQFRAADISGFPSVPEAQGSVHQDDQALARLRADYPGHRIWRSVRGNGLLGDWCATLHDPAAGMDPTVIRSTAEKLRDALIKEKYRAEAKY
ncbi:hypothetical protein [Actinomadura xylanilytica]|uniref:hypothetical protein n=1 Tax=Actinomadura xylanilytica TaxID=887459 RepID=UPI00255ACDAA|nr:hypothetical protein [Actinomadura xylanilytica]MDL4775748.1 hypothetical protein [Actinomadura xylanilytica]